ncbi:DNA cytosine methyltransferase [Actinoplanes sp. NPDC051861]|uniref:DNA cytosine methyltransferase n=1 Tax=Actinoplanes sp. NPDC051861 TaxID=3155170 RepID=UPI003434A5C1
MTVEPINDSASSEETEKLRLIDLFAGCGGLTSGFVNTGRFRPVGAVEQNHAAASTYAANFGADHMFAGDIEEWVESGTVPDADVVIGGPPCQGFSTLGRRDPDDPRNQLWNMYVDVLNRSGPRAFLLENVPQFGKSQEFASLKAETANGRLQNYQLRFAVVRATDYGAAQLRRRFIVIGTHRDLPAVEIPAPTVREAEWRTVRDEIGDLQFSVDPGNTELPASSTTFFRKSLPGRFKASDLDLARNYRQLTIDRMNNIPEGGDRRSLPIELMAKCWIGRTAGMDVMARLRWDRPSVTIRTEFFKPEKGRYLHPVENRTISHHEAARLQGFRDTFEWCGTKNDIARQIGNAVPVQLAEAMATHIAARISQTG